MPYLLIRSNRQISEAEQSSLLAEACKIVASSLAKPEKYVMVGYEPTSALVFDSKPDPAVFLDLRSIGIPEPARKTIAGALAKCMVERLDVSADRVYLVMTDVPAKHWGQGETTFG
jgi:phenylpyruvate tautomerase